jgi:ferredoxin
METKYKNLVIYCFSGTGNSENVARWILATAAEMNIAASMIHMATVDHVHMEPPPSDALIVFISPIHGFNYPPLVLGFIARFPKGKNKAVLMNTRAGMLIGKFITPGLTGAAFYFSALILWLKGYSIVGMRPVDLPSNWISVHPGLNERTVKFLHEKNKSRVEQFARKVLNGEKSFKALREIVQDLAVAPISLMYYFAGRFMIARTYYASRDCNGCDLCIRNCPAKAIIKVNDRPYWTFRCESCMRCMSYCPKKSIETGHGFVLAIILVYILVIPLFYSAFEKMFFRLESGLLQFIVETAIFLMLTAVLYRVMHYALRFKFFERFMVYTSLTRYKFWGRRYKALKNF